MGRRILVTGADTLWGRRVVQALEADPGMEAILGIGTGPGTGSPPVRFDRAELVQVDQTYAALSRIVRATRVDTVVHASLAVDSSLVRPRDLHEINVIGTMHLLAAAGAPGSTVRQVVATSSTLVYGSTAHDPNTFAEETARSSAPRTPVERSLTEAEAMVRDFAADNPATPVTVLRLADVLGAERTTPISRNLSRPLCPSILGFDPLLQFVEEEDAVRAVEFVTREQVPGIFNVAGAGHLPWSEVTATCGTRLVPLPPLHPAWAAAPLSRLGLGELPPELASLLRYGRGVDTRRLVAAGFDYRCTSAGAVRAFARALHLRRRCGGRPDGGGSRPGATRPP